MSDPLELAKWMDDHADRYYHRDETKLQLQAAAAALRAGAEREATLTRERDEALAALRAVVSRRSEGSFVKALDDARALLAKGETT